MAGAMNRGQSAVPAGPNALDEEINLLIGAAEELEKIVGNAQERLSHVRCEVPATEGRGLGSPESPRSPSISRLRDARKRVETQSATLGILVSQLDV